MAKLVLDRDYHTWTFKWLRDRDGGPGFFCAHVAAYSRAELIKKVASLLGEPWKQIYRDGGRAVRVKFVEV